MTDLPVPTEKDHERAEAILSALRGSGYVVVREGEIERLRAALADIEAAALRGNGPLARDLETNTLYGIGMWAQGALNNGK